MPLPDLDILVAVAEANSLTDAAVQLGIPRPTLSRRLTRLEEQMGAVLVHRTTRQLALTEAGEELYRHARPIVDAVEVAAGAVRAPDGTPRGLLRVTLPGGSALVTEMLLAFCERFPEVRLELVATARHVDLIDEGIDVAMRAGQLTGPSLVSRRLAHVDAVVVASPDYLARRGTPASGPELASHECLVGFSRGEVPQRSWPLLDGGEVPVQQRMAANLPSFLVAAAVAGHGLALVPEPFARSALEAGTLVHVLSDEVGVRSGIWLVYPEKRLMLPRVRAFIDHVVAWSEHEALNTV